MTVFHMLCNETVCRAPLQLGCLVVGSQVTSVAVGCWAPQLAETNLGGLLVSASIVFTLSLHLE